MGGRVVETQTKERSVAGNKGLASAIPSPIPQPKSQREPVPVRELACTTQTLKTPNAVLLRTHPSGGGSDSLPVPQGPSQSGP